MKRRRRGLSKHSSRSVSTRLKLLIFFAGLFVGVGIGVSSAIYVLERDSETVAGSLDSEPSGFGRFFGEIGDLFGLEPASLDEMECGDLVSGVLNSVNNHWYVGGVSYKQVDTIAPSSLEEVSRFSNSEFSEISCRGNGRSVGDHRLTVQFDATEYHDDGERSFDIEWRLSNGNTATFGPDGTIVLERSSLGLGR